MAETLGAIFFSGSEERAQSSLVPPLFLRHSPPPCAGHYVQPLALFQIMKVIILLKTWL